MNLSNPYLLCCDWGTSSFRLRLVDRRTGSVIDELQTDEGVSVIAQRWGNIHTSTEQNRESFFLRFLQSQINVLENESAINLEHVPAILTGMASSSIGMRELPYAHTPFPLDGSGIVAESIEDKNRKILLVSGLRTPHEVMRGEEIQLIGLEDRHTQLEHLSTNMVIVLPGTHSKHVHVENKAVQTFTTAMTGELFDLLGSSGVLSHSVIRPEKPIDSAGWKAFCEGVHHSSHQSLLHALFRVRTNELLYDYVGVNNFYFLSGLLIGAELQDLRALHHPQILLCSSENLREYYVVALEELSLGDQIHSVSTEEFRQATVQSQIKIATQWGL